MLKGLPRPLKSDLKLKLVTFLFKKNPREMYSPFSKSQLLLVFYLYIK